MLVCSMQVPTQHNTNSQVRVARAQTRLISIVSKPIKIVVVVGVFAVVLLGSIFGSLFGPILGLMLGQVLGLILGLNNGINIGVQYWVQH